MPWIQILAVHRHRHHDFLFAFSDNVPLAITCHETKYGISGPISAVCMYSYLERLAPRLDGKRKNAIDVLLFLTVSF